MAEKTPRPSRPDPAAPNPSKNPQYPSAPEVVAVAKREARLRTTMTGIASAAGEDVSSLAKVLKGVALVPLFGASEERVMAQVARASAESGVEQPDLSVFYRVEAPPERAEEVADQLRDNDLIETAYVKPPAEPPQVNNMTPSPVDAPPVTPDFTASQFYLERRQPVSKRSGRTPGPAAKGPTSASSTSKAHGGSRMKTSRRCRAA